MKAALFIALCGSLVLSAGCIGSESRAGGLYDDAITLIESGELEQATGLLERIVAEYPDTRAAEEAGKELEHLRSVTGAVRNYPVSAARDLMVRTARVLERYRYRRRLPESLAALVPGALDTVPVDPWGAELIYSRTRNGRGYTLASFGADGAPGGEGADADILIRNGEFVTGGW